MELLVFDTNTMISKRDTNHGIRNIYWTVYGDIRYQILDTNLKPENEKVCVQVHLEDIPHAHNTHNKRVFF